MKAFSGLKQSEPGEQRMEKGKISVIISVGILFIILCAKAIFTAAP